MLKATVNQKNILNLDVSKEKIKLEDQLFEWDMVKISPGFFHILYQNQSFNLEVVEADFSKKEFIFNINGKPCQVSLQDSLDLLIEKLGLQDQRQDELQVIKAPMPGLILQLHVNEGDEVKEQDALVTLEAMKMENVIRAQKDGKISAVKVKKGDSVGKNQVLIEF